MNFYIVVAPKAYGVEGAHDYWGTLQIRTRPSGIGGGGIGVSPGTSISPLKQTNKQKGRRR